MSYASNQAMRLDFLDKTQAALLNKDFAAATEQDLIVSGALMRALMSGFEFSADYVQFYAIFVSGNLENALQQSVNLDIFNAMLDRYDDVIKLAQQDVIMRGIAASPTAMNAIAASPTALGVIFSHVSAYTALMCSPYFNNILFTGQVASYFAGLFSYVANTFWTMRINPAIAGTLTVSSAMASTSTSYDDFIFYSGPTGTSSDSSILNVKQNSTSYQTFGPADIALNGDFLTLYVENGSNNPVVANLDSIGFGHPSNQRRFNQFILTARGAE